MGNLLLLICELVADLFLQIKVPQNAACIHPVFGGEDHNCFLEEKSLWPWFGF